MTTWVLTSESFDGLLASLCPDRERAGERYEEVRRRLLKFFEWRGSAAPEERADQTLNRVARKLEEGERVENVEAFVMGVARMVWLEELKERRRAGTAFERSPAFVTETPDEFAERRLECFEKCLASLPAAQRELIVEYYRGEKGEKIERRKKLAEAEGVGSGALRIRAHRIRAGLEACVARCLKAAGF